MRIRDFGRGFGPNRGAAAPFGSMYHHFPGGKEELGGAAIATSGLAYGDLIDLFFGDDVTELVEAAEAFFAGAGSECGILRWSAGPTSVSRLCVHQS